MFLTHLFVRSDAFLEQGGSVKNKSGINTTNSITVNKK